MSLREGEIAERERNTTLMGADEEERIAGADAGDRVEEAGTDLGIVVLDGLQHRDRPAAQAHERGRGGRSDLRVLGLQPGNLLGDAGGEILGLEKQGDGTDEGHCPYSNLSRCGGGHRLACQTDGLAAAVIGYTPRP